MNVLGLVVARGGSKGIPGKNYKQFCGMPLVDWTLQAASKSARINHVVLSTDSEEIGALAHAHGADYLKRPFSLATDKSPVFETELHAVDYLTGWDRTPDVIVRLQPTSPLRTAIDIDAAIGKMFDTAASAVVGISPVTDHPKLVVRQTGHRIRVDPGKSPRQQYRPAYRVNGAIYAARLDYWKANQGYFGTDTVGWVMRRDCGWDIDEPLDWDIAEMLMQKRLAA